ncbi:MAG: hypothetical protein ACI96M_004123 [Candidatus Azotimanducaceae bacterium]|jgi:hypothetical protein
MVIHPAPANPFNALDPAVLATFEDEAQHQSFRLELSQILTNSYRSLRFQDSSSAIGYSYQAENYPGTRNSDAIAVRAMYYLPYRAALGA